MTQQCLFKEKEEDSVCKMIDSQKIPEEHPCPETMKKMIDTEYIIGLINRDNYIFDMRCWPNGITAQEFFARWNNNWEDVQPWWNAGHFAYACRTAKKRYDADPELIWTAMEKRRVEAVTTLANSWAETIISHLETAKKYGRSGDFILRDTWIGHAIKSWESANLCLKELGKEEKPIPKELQDFIREVKYGDK